MSLILEALRKSEAERRRGQVPDLHAERAPAVAATRATAPAWPWLALALGVAATLAWLAGGAWSAGAGGGAPGPLDPPASSPDARAAAGAQDLRAGDRAAAAAALSVEPAPPPTPARAAATPPQPRAGANPVAAANAAALPPRFESTGTPSRAARADAAGTPSRAARADAADAGPGVASPPPPIVASPLPRAVAAAPAPASEIGAVAARAPPATTPAGAAGNPSPPLRLSDLSTAERLELPPLKISMHLWDPSPARRFAIIDGARVNEGDRIGDAVVEEITANAVLLAWRGRQLHIPLR